MPFIFSKVSQSFRQSGEDYAVKCEAWREPGHTDGLLAECYSVPCHLRWGLSSLHGRMDSDGLLNCLCLQDLLL